jgi:surfactin synthase thioesterase subunit
VNTQDQKNLWLLLTQKSLTAEHNLICFPFAGGHAEYYLPWRRELPDAMNLCPVQLPGRSYRWQEAGFDNMNALLNAMLPFLENQLLKQPYILFGHSMGGYITYELAKLIAQRGLPLPKALVISAVPAPTYWSKRRKLSSLSEQEFKQLFLSLGGFHSELLRHKTFIDMQFALLRRDILLCESCQYSGPANFAFPIIALGAQDDGYVNIENLTDWQLETTMQFYQYEFTGGHFYLNNRIKEILNIINDISVLS